MDNTKSSAANSVNNFFMLFWFLIKTGTRYERLLKMLII